MHTVTSHDGTPIVFDRSGEGPPVILVTGALATRAACASLVALLAPHFTVIAHDRRGRGDSGDTPPYAVEREVEDIDALITVVGGAAFVFGHSSGAALALEAARLLPTKIARLALYEPPFIVDDSRPPLPRDYVAQMTERVAAGRRGDAVEYFMTAAVAVPDDMVAQMRSDPMWPTMEAVAHTLPYDGAIMGDTMFGQPLPAARWAIVTLPTLVLDGGASPTWQRNGVQTLVAALPNAEQRTLAGQGHGADPDVLAPVLAEFFAS